MSPSVYRWYWQAEGEWLVGAGLSAAELRDRRLGLGMSQRQLADELGVTPTTLARWERGERTISNPVLVRLALDHLATGPRRRRSRAALARLPLIGRDRDLAAVSALLARRGPAGDADRARAARARRRWRSPRSKAAAPRGDGACLVELADISGSAGRRGIERPWLRPSASGRSRASR